MKKRGYKPDETWYNPNYRGKTLGEQPNWTTPLLKQFLTQDRIFIEHNDEYLQECLDNLKGKGICIDLN